MAKGVAAKGFKMTQGRKAVLVLLAEEGGELRSKEGKATSLMHGLLEYGGSMVALNAMLRQLEELGFIKREVEGRRTYAISITEVGASHIDVDVKPKTEEISAPADEVSKKRASKTTKATEDGTSAAPSVEENWDWKEAEVPAIPEEIDYDILLSVFLKAAIRGMENSSNGQVEYYQQENTRLESTVAKQKAQIETLQAKEAALIASNDQLEKNLKVIMSKSQAQGGTRGTDPINKLLSAKERGELAKLMQQLPSRRG